MPPYITRFAPSPTGRLHLGHAASAFAVWADAGVANGEVLLRIEDIDQTRCKPEYEAAIYEDLHWLGLTWDTAKVRRQSDQMAEYAAVIDDLAARGLVYRCFRNRRDLITNPPAPLPQAIENERLLSEQPYAWRLNLAAARDAIGPKWDTLSFQDTAHGKIAVTPDILGDVVLARKDAGTSYHLACCHDDAVQGITHITRGMDLWESTHVHILLQVLMGWPRPVYHHHALIMAADGEKLSKRKGSKTLADLRNEGVTPEQIRAMTRA